MYLEALVFSQLRRLSPQLVEKIVEHRLVVKAVVHAMVWIPPTEQHPHRQWKHGL
jgi:hypothetical protein